jgi:hypothetical protein
VGAGIVQATAAAVVGDFALHAIAAADAASARRLTLERGRHTIPAVYRDREGATAWASGVLPHIGYSPADPET